jgi:hypothetical protein
MLAGMNEEFTALLILLFIIPPAEPACEVNTVCFYNLVIYLSMALQPFVGPWPLFQVLNPYALGRAPWTGDQSVARLLTYTQNNTNSE